MTTLWAITPHIAAALPLTIPSSSTHHGLASPRAAINGEWVALVCFYSHSRLSIPSVRLPLSLPVHTRSSRPRVCLSVKKGLRCLCRPRQAAPVCFEPQTAPYTCLESHTHIKVRCGGPHNEKMETFWCVAFSLRLVLVRVLLCCCLLQRGKCRRRVVAKWRRYNRTEQLASPRDTPGI